MSEAQFLIFPINLSNTARANSETWEITGQTLKKYRNHDKIKQCYLARKDWILNQFTTDEVTRKFVSYIQYNKKNKTVINAIINSYLNHRILDDYKNYTEIITLPEPNSSISNLNQAIELFGDKKDEYAEIIQYVRKNKNNLDWIVIKSGSLNSKLKDNDANFLKSLTRFLVSSYSVIENENYRLNYDKKCNITYNMNQQTSVTTYNVDPILKELISKSSATLPLYSLQIAVGDAIFNKITNCIYENNRNFTAFKLIILVPPRTSLKNQTITRLQQTYSKAMIRDLKNSSNIDIDFVYMAHSQNLKNYELIISGANQNKNCLYLIIQDECHWGMLKDSVLDKYLNSNSMIESQNIYVLYVSATPYNISILKKMNWNTENQVIKWDDIAEQNNDLKQENEKYVGLKRLNAQNKIKLQSDISKNCVNKLVSFKEIAHIFINKSFVENQQSNLVISEPEVSILLEYKITLHFLFLKNKFKENFHEQSFKEKFPLSDFITDETLEILETFFKRSENGKGGFALLRMNNSVIAKLFRDWMFQLIDYFDKDLFDVVLDINDNDDNLWDCLSSESQIKFKEWRGLNEAPSDITYNDLVGIPILLIVVEKARMGDTLPSNFKHFDLRCRYNAENGAQTIYSSLLQDVGRAFGYGERPNLFITKFIWKYLDPNTDNNLKPHQTLKAEDQNTEEDTEFLDPLDPLSSWNISKKHQLFENNDLLLAFERRFLLSAHPQNGKTGAFLHTIQKFIEKLKNNSSLPILNQQITPNTSSILTTNFIPDCEVRENTLNDFKKKRYLDLLYKLKNIQESNLKNHLSSINDDIKNEWYEFHDLLREYCQSLKNNNFTLNHEYCIESIKSYCSKNALISSSIKILDLGCGNAQIAQYFFNANDQKFVYKSKSREFNLDIINIDYLRHKSVPSYIKITETEISRALSLFEIKQEYFDIIIFCCSLWGTDQDVLNYIINARKLIKKSGRIIIVENNKNLTENSRRKTELITRKAGHLFLFKFDELNNDFLMLTCIPEDEVMEVDD